MDSSRMRKLPRRATEVISNEFDGEFVVLDTRTDHAHALSGAVAMVWRAAEQGSWPDLPDAEVDEIVTELLERGLLVADGLSRRTLLKVGAAAAGGTLAMGGISSLALPTAAMAASAHPLIFTEGGTIEIPPGGVIQYTILGGGGGGGGTTGDGLRSGGHGGQALPLSGSIVNSVANGRQTLAIVIGQEGQGGGGCNPWRQLQAANGGAGYESGANGGIGGWPYFSEPQQNERGRGRYPPPPPPRAPGSAGGGGGGSTAILITNERWGRFEQPTALVVAGAGGGAGGSAAAQGTAGDPTGSGATGFTATNGGNGNAGGGGGGGGHAGGIGGAGGPGGRGGAGGTSARGAVSGWTVTGNGPVVAPGGTGSYGQGGPGGSPSGHSGLNGVQGVAYITGSILSHTGF